MDPQTAQSVLTIITAVAVVVWLFGLLFLSASARAAKPAAGDDPADAVLPPTPSSTWMTGRAEVEGQPAVLAAKAAALLARGGPIGLVQIKEKTADQITFERLGPDAGGWFRHGELRFAPARQGRSRIEWAVELTNMSWLLGLGALFQVLGLLAISVGCWAIAAFVISSPDPAVRWQTVQMVQVIHFLWPPFLFGALYRSRSKQAAAVFGALAANLPYCGE